MARLLLLLCATLLIGASPAQKYAEGQVWSYKTRPGEEGSLLKIQEIENSRGGPIFHISVIGFHLANPSIKSMLQHAPVSQQTLDASVISLHGDPGNFPPLSAVEEGITEWRTANGGVFTISVAEIVQVMDDTTGKQPAAQP